MVIDEINHHFFLKLHFDMEKLKCRIATQVLKRPIQFCLLFKDEQPHAIIS